MKYSRIHIWGLGFATVYTIFDEIIRRVYSFTKSKLVDDEPEHLFGKGQGTFSEERDKIEVDGLSSYRLTANEEYRKGYLAYGKFTQ